MNRSWTSVRLSVAFCFLANGLLIGAWAPQIPLLRQRFQLTESGLGLAILVFGLGALLAMPATGRAIARFGSRRVVIASGLANSAGLALVVVSPALPAAIIAIFAFGAMIGAMDVAMNANAVAAERHLKRAIMSSSHAFWSVGGFLGASAGGWLVAASSPSIQAALAGTACFILVAIASRILVEDKPLATHERSGASARWPRHGLPYALGLLALIAMIPEGAILDWAALHLVQSFDVGIAHAGLGFALFSAAMAVMRFMGDGLRARFGAVRVMRVSAVIAGLSLMLAALAPSANFAIVGFTLAGLGIANIVPIVFSAAGNLPGLAPGIAMSVATTIGYSGILLAPSVIGVIAERVGFAPVYAGLGFLVLTLAIAAGAARHAQID